MKRLDVQIQPALASSLDVKAAVARLTALGHGVTVTEGVDDGPYVNVGFEADDLVQSQATSCASVWRVLP